MNIQDVVLWIELIHLVYLECLLLERSQLEKLIVVDAAELCLSVVNRVCSFAQIEIDDVDAINLLHVLVVLSTVNVLRHKLRGAEEDALEISEFGLALNLDEQKLAFFVLCKQVYTVVFRIVTVLVALAFQQAVNLNLGFKQCGEKTFQNVEVGLVAKQTLQSPVKTDVSAVCHWYVRFVTTLQK